VARTIYQTEIGRTADALLRLLPAERLVVLVQNELHKKEITCTTKQVSDRIDEFPRNVERFQGAFSNQVKPFIQTLLDCMEKLSNNYKPMVDILREAIHFRGPRKTKGSATWITQLLAGEIINTTGPNGYGPYRLTWVGEADDDEE